MKNSLIILFVLSFSSIFSQTTDTVTVMTYNLMWYRGNPSFCTPPSANVRDDAMEDIVDHVVPDLLVVNEMDGDNSLSPARLQLNALNQNGRSFYSAAKRSGTSQDIINMLYYNKNKFVLESQTDISKDLNNVNLVRVIDIYTLRYLDTNLSVHNDTIRLYVVAAHLKAGSGTSNENERADATEAVMAYLDSNNIDGNLLFAGDLNIYNSSEDAYGNLISYVDTSLRFYDPINRAGNWNNRSAFARIHTQSTRSSASGCFSGGGMDDRFDFILASEEILDSTNSISYISNTYKALGQDGRRFNGSINSPLNTSVPASVVTALNDMSDHLPVIMDLKIKLPTTTSIVDHRNLPSLRYVNPCKNILKIDLREEENNVKRIEILSFTGQYLKDIQLQNRSIIEEDISNLSSGTYLIRVTYKGFQQSIDKLIKI